VSQDVDDKVVFLTFDDGIDPTLTPQVMDILKEYGVHATFFHIGYTISQENADILKRQITEGHAIANHSLSHNFNLLYPGRVPNKSQIVSEVDQTNANFQAILGKDFKTRIFRYPGGHMSWQGLEATDHALANQGIQWIDWNMLCGDAEPASVRPTTSETMMAYMDGSQQYFPESHVKVVLMHDTAGKELTVQTLPQIIEYFKNQGYTFGVLE
ncbi:MAG: polysaccharide deacetylase family protein, partial [Streptococcus sp.]|nr:polysaccharide deacetylase family protein [Streptococcus sp.]